MRAWPNRRGWSSTAVSTPRRRRGWWATAAVSGRFSTTVNNAIKFTDSGHVVARLRAEVLPDGRARLHFQVVDSGVGISAENQVRLFEPFYQIDSGSHPVRGAGIGLSICARPPN